MVCLLYNLDSQCVILESDLTNKEENTRSILFLAKYKKVNNYFLRLFTKLST